MRELWIMLVIAVATVTLGCGEGGSGDAAKHGEDESSPAGAEAAARGVMEATKKNDCSAILDFTDLKGFYDTLSTRQRRGLSLQEWERRLRANWKYLDEPFPELEYEIFGTEMAGVDAVVKLRDKPKKGDDWLYLELPFRKVGGAWKLTPEWFEDFYEEQDVEDN